MEDKCNKRTKKEKHKKSQETVNRHHDLLLSRNALLIADANHTRQNHTVSPQRLRDTQKHKEKCGGSQTAKTRGPWTWDD